MCCTVSAALSESWQRLVCFPCTHTFLRLLIRENRPGGPTTIFGPFFSLNTFLLFYKCSYGKQKKRRRAFKHDHNRFERGERITLFTNSELQKNSRGHTFQGNLFLTLTFFTLYSVLPCDTKLILHFKLIGYISFHWGCSFLLQFTPCWHIHRMCFISAYRSWNMCQKTHSFQMPAGHDFRTYKPWNHYTVASEWTTVPCFSRGLRILWTINTVCSGGGWCKSI